MEEKENLDLEKLVVDKEKECIVVVVVDKEKEVVRREQLVLVEVVLLGEEKTLAVCRRSF